MTTLASPPVTDPGASTPVAAIIIRGRIIESDLISFQGRGDNITFQSPDPHRYIDQLPLASPSLLKDMYALTFDEILDYLVELGERLNIDYNEHMQWARELTYATAPRTRPLIDNDFNGMASMFSRERIREMADRTIGLDYLNGWVDTTLNDGTVASVRAFGARALHIIPGNGGKSAAQTIIRNAFTRSDCIIKTPSNNPFGAIGVGRTMCEMAPDHPITKHVAIAYWRGGDEELEQRLFQPHNIEKIVAWGGLASVKHVTKYIQPGLELISLDPKYSGSVVGPQALGSDEQMREAALRIAVDMGTGNQTGCSSSRTVYVVTDGRADGVELTTKLGGYVYEELIGLPEGLSTKPKLYDAELRSNVDALRLQDDWYAVIGGEEDEGCVIVSQLSDPIDFTSLLADRTVNIVPVDRIEDAIARFDSYTQTIGVFPEALKADLIDIAPLYGVQRFVSLGYSAKHTWCTPHDGLELDRRMCKWVVNLKVESFPLAYAGSGDRSAADVLPVTPGTLDAVRVVDRKPEAAS